MAARKRGGPVPHDPSTFGIPRDFGRDGITPMVNHDRALRAREVSRPRPEDEAHAARTVDDMLRRLRRSK